MKNILLVNPDIDSDIAPYEAILRLPFLDKRTFMTPLHLATLAALTPDDIKVDIWDEPVHGRIDETTHLKDYDLVGVTGYTAHLRGAIRLARLFRKRGIPVVIGGPAASAAPERYRDDCDVLFIGEAEYIWGQFISDWKAGAYQKEYRQVIKPDITDSPLPRWDSVAEVMKHYVVGGVQTTRGCPFDCEFCDVIFLYGRQPRHKSVERVIEEVCALERLGVDSIFFCDDNFIGNPRYAKDLLRELIPVNNSFAKPLTYQTQITLNVAKDDEFLELLADANFSTLFVGVETPNIESLKETNKPQNYKTDILADVHKILSYGLPIKAGMIVGFDHDDQTIFDRQFEFIQEACIPVPAINMLKIPLGTKLWSRMLKERRVIVGRDDVTRYVEELRAQTNLIPKQMTRVELMTGYKHLLERVDDWENFAKRIKGFVSMVKRRPNVTYKQPSEENARLILQQLFNAIEDEKARMTIFDMLSSTRQQAPFMLRKIFALIVQHIGVAGMSEPLRAALDKQIALESSIPSYEPYIDKRPIFIPDSFQEAYRKVFPEIYQRVLDGLIDKSLLPEALIEVFTDFVMRWGETFEGMEDHHQVALQEIADRTIAAKNRTPGLQKVAHPGEDVSDTRTQMNQLRIEVLKSVERDLRKFDDAHSSDHSSSLEVYGTRFASA
ncbi:radical SAM protein [Candidatus Poribacteria bacterium]|nr:radical SAM protein [Candidatus Poribacteria bacterium]